MHFKGIIIITYTPITRDEADYITVKLKQREMQAMNQD